MAYRYQTRLYWHGLFASFLGGVSNSIVVMIIDPAKFNFMDLIGLRNVAIAAVGSGVFSFFLYIREHPLPDPVKDIDAVSASQNKISAITQAMQ